MKAIVVEDSMIARQGLINMLKDHPDVDIIGDAENADEALDIIENNRPELLFLDIQLPGMSGFELLEQLEFSPHVIFTTAYSEYAIRSFDYNTADYLLKPIRYERLCQAIEKIKTRALPDEVSEDASQEPMEMLDLQSQMFIKDNEECHLVELVKIRLFESCKNHTRVYFNDVKPFIRRSLSKIEQRLPAQTFFRINRQQIINLTFVQSIEEWVNDGYRVVMKDGMELEVSRRHSVRLKAAMSF